MKAHSVNEQNNFMGGWYIDPAVCDEIVAKGENHPNVFSAGVKEYRDCDLQSFDPVLYKKYCEQLFKALEAYKELYPLCYKYLRMWGLTQPRIQRYDPGAAYRIEHCENNGEGFVLTRHLAYMTYLNDIKDGGGTEFIHQGVTTDAETGLTLFWPAGWTHYHRGVVSETETKYIITGWCCFYPDDAENKLERG